MCGSFRLRLYRRRTAGPFISDDPPSADLYPLSLHDALPISAPVRTLLHEPTPAPRVEVEGARVRDQLKREAQSEYLVEGELLPALVVRREDLDDELGASLEPAARAVLRTREADVRRPVIVGG